MAMETDSLLMDDMPDGTTVSHRRSPRSLLSRSGSRHAFRESSDEELLDINLSLPRITDTDDRSHGTDIIFAIYKILMYCLLWHIYNICHFLYLMVYQWWLM